MLTILPTWKMQQNVSANRCHQKGHFSTLYNYVFGQTILLLKAYLIYLIGYANGIILL